MSESPSPIHKAALVPIRVLMLEHELADIELALNALTGDGLQIEMDVVSTRSEFNLNLGSKSYDVVLADYRLPGWNGMEALTEIQQRGLNLPLILVTGTLGEHKAVECIKLGASDYVLKDHLARLPAAVRRALEQKTLRDERARNAKALAQSAANFRFLFAKNPIP